MHFEIPIVGPLYDLGLRLDERLGRTDAVGEGRDFVQPVFAQENSERTYIKIEVDGLSCPFCAYGFEKKLKKVKEVRDIFIDIQEGFATLNVPNDDKPTEEELRKIVKDAGFTAREITFSSTPFKEHNEK